MLSDAQFGEVHARLASEGGFTVNPRTGASITSGYSVAPRANERKIPIPESTPGTLRQYAQDYEHTWQGQHNASLGGWRSEDTDYLDTPTVYKNTGQGESAARKQMVLSGQEAGFHLDTFQEVFNPFHAEGRRKAGREPHEIADIAGRGVAGSEFAARQPEVQAWIRAPRERAAHAREAR